jgi:UrcA family protein
MRSNPSLRATLVALATATSLAVPVALIVPTPSSAQTYVSYNDEVVVTAPYAVRRRDGTVTVTRVVSARDLNLYYGADVDRLHQRVVDAAYLACEEAEDALRGRSVTSDRECFRKAMRGATPQFQAVVARARY